MKTKNTRSVSAEPGTSAEALKCAEKGVAFALAAAKRAKRGLKAAKKTAKRAKKNLKAAKKKFKTAAKKFRRAEKNTASAKRSTLSRKPKKLVANRKKGGQKSRRPLRSLRRPARRQIAPKPATPTIPALAKSVLTEPNSSLPPSETGTTLPASGTDGQAGQA